jgi:Ca2+:H+ antiporter
MVPSANLFGFASRELAKKLPHRIALIVDPASSSVVEIIVFTTLIQKGNRSVPIIKDAIIGSMMANLLLCLGLCCISGIRKGREEIELHDTVSKVGGPLMLVACMAIVLPTGYSTAFNGSDHLDESVLRISRVFSITLLLALVMYVYFQMSTHKGLYEEMLGEEDDEDADLHRDGKTARLTMTEAILALLFSLAMVSIMAIFLVDRIDYLETERRTNGV